ncbi:MAG: sensor histidine kinase, partial [Balneolaceae bacterium]
MRTLLPSNRVKIILVSMLALLAAASFVYNQFLINKIMEQERRSIQLWAKAFEFNNLPVHQQVSADLNWVANELRNYPNVPDSLSRIIESSESAKSTIDFVTRELIIPDLFNIPVIVVDDSDFVTTYRYLDEDDDPYELVEEFAALNDPIPIVFGEEPRVQQQFVYYGESPTIQYLRYFPYVQFGILALLFGVGYTTYKSITRSEQSNLWVGMTKEAAHQMGTPLSSMYGWLELLKDEHQNNEETLSIVYEIENDVSR